MSLAARCPWCETVFRLTEGQVSAKGGMARCGICSHTFNALDALLSDSAVAALERSAQARKASEENSFRKTDPLGPQRTLVLDGDPSAPLKTDAPTPSSHPQPVASAPSTLRDPSMPPAASVVQPQSPGAAVAPSPASPVAPPATPPAAPFSPLSSLRLPAFLMGNRQAAPAPAAPISINPAPAVPESKSAVPEPVIAPPPSVAPPAASSHAASSPAVSLSAAPSPAPTVQVDHSPPTVAAETSNDGLASQGAEVNDELVANYEVALPNYEEAAPESLEADEPAVESEGEIAAQIDELQAALAAAEERPAPPVLTLAELRPQVALPLSRNEIASENERLGPSTFQPSFLASDDGSPGWRRVRTFFTFVFCVIAFVAVLGQSAYWWRTDLAVKVPALKPYLELGCARLRCEVMPPAQIEQLSIESSELVAVPGVPNTLAFTALLRNHSVTAMAYPAIEVTLTDARDRAVLRRDFLPNSYLNDASRQRQLAGMTPNSEFTIKLTFDTSGVATAGYRAAIFYP